MVSVRTGAFHYIEIALLQNRRSANTAGADRPVAVSRVCKYPSPRAAIRAYAKPAVRVGSIGRFCRATEPSTSGGRSLLQSRPHAWPSFLRKRDPVPSPQRRDTGSAVLVCGWPTFRGVRANPEGRPSSETASAFSGIRPPSDPAACASPSRRQATAGPNRTYQASRVRARWSCRRPHRMHRASEIGRSRSCSCPACN